MSKYLFIKIGEKPALGCGMIIYGALAFGFFAGIINWFITLSELGAIKEISRAQIDITSSFYFSKLWFVIIPLLILHVVIIVQIPEFRFKLLVALLIFIGEMALFTWVFYLTYALSSNNDLSLYLKNIYDTNGIDYHAWYVFASDTAEYLSGIIIFYASIAASIVGLLFSVFRR